MHRLCNEPLDLWMGEAIERQLCQVRTRGPWRLKLWATGQQR